MPNSESRGNEPVVSQLRPEVAAAASVLHYLRRKDLTPTQRDMLTADYAQRRGPLSDQVLTEFDDEVIRLHVPESSRDERRVIQLHQAEAAVPQPESEPPASGNVTRPRLAVPAAPIDIDVAIINIIPIELRATQDVFGINRRDFTLGPDGSRYYAATVPSSHLERELAIVLANAEGAYDLKAMHAVSQLAQLYRPAAIFLVGIAAGHPDEFELGDVAVPGRVMSYEASREQSGESLPRPRYLNTPAEMVRNLNYYFPQREGFGPAIKGHFKSLQKADRPEDLKLATFKPKLKLGATVAAGARLIADGVTLPALRRLDERAILADQESFGFAEALQVQKKLWAIFRGISDFGDPAKGKNWQYVAASTAALALRDFLITEYLPLEAQ